MTLVATAVIVFGATLLLSSGVTYHVDLLASKLGETALSGTHILAAIVASGVQVLVGVAAIALGIIALIDVSPMILALVGLLILGTSIVISGSAVCATIANTIQREPTR
jgi:hypothetical protein